MIRGIISREEAIRLAPDYVAFSEGNHDKYKVIASKFDDLKKGQTALTHTDDQFIIVKVSSINSHDIRAIDGPIVRVTNGEFSWRVDGCDYAYPIKKKTER